MLMRRNVSSVCPLKWPKICPSASRACRDGENALIYECS